MADSFRPVFETMKQVADGLIHANEGLIQASEGLKKMADAVLEAHDEHEDRDETIARLESLVVTQGQELQSLRADVKALRKHLGGDAPA
jgi:type II secretory pathway predicted ATPase ExeA